MDRVDQPMPVALGRCTISNRLAATISVYVAYVRGRVFHELVGGSVQRFGTVFEGNRNLDVTLVHPRRK